jgi:hypothetical protein
MCAVDKTVTWLFTFCSCRLRSIFKNVIISANNKQKKKTDPVTYYLCKHAINYYNITVSYTMQEKKFFFLQNAPTNSEATQSTNQCVRGPLRRG